MWHNSDNWERPPPPSTNKRCSRRAPTGVVLSNAPGRDSNLLVAQRGTHIVITFDISAEIGPLSTYPSAHTWKEGFCTIEPLVVFVLHGSVRSETRAMGNPGAAFPPRAAETVTTVGASEPTESTKSPAFADVTAVAASVPSVSAGADGPEPVTTDRIPSNPMAAYELRDDRTSASHHRICRPKTTQTT